MSFFDGLPASPPPPEPPDETLELCAYAPAEDEEFAPSHWFVPARLPQVAEAGAGPDVRIVLTGWEVWPRSVTMRLSVFLRRIRPGGRTSPYGGPRDRALRCGLLLADGRKVTTLDGAPLPTAGPPHPTLRPVGGSGGAFHHELELHLSQLPPAGATQLVVEWPDEQVPETVTVFDAGPLRAAAGEALEIWPDAAPPARRRRVRNRGVPHRRPGPGGDPGPAARVRAAAVVPARPGPARGDWELLAPFHWRDTALVLGRLANGADPRALVPGHPRRPRCTWPRPTAPRGRRRAPRPRRGGGRTGRTGPHPLWHAVCHGAEGNAALLLRAGADAWRPQVAGRSPAVWR
ncbi:hypothetical protein O1L44_08925 [Streptomyces noursei]|nr:hypothetical protein [Streptomyces noursei]